MREDSLAPFPFQIPNIASFSAYNTEFAFRYFLAALSFCQFLVRFYWSYTSYPHWRI